MTLFRFLFFKLFNSHRCLLASHSDNLGVSCKTSFSCSSDWCTSSAFYFPLVSIGNFLRCDDNTFLYMMEIKRYDGSCTSYHLSNKIIFHSQVWHLLIKVRPELFKFLKMSPYLIWSIVWLWIPFSSQPPKPCSLSG